MRELAQHFREVWALDFEFRQPDGEALTEVHCMVAHELLSGRKLRLWRDELDVPPFRIDDSTLFVVYMVAAEMSCFLALNWPLPRGARPLRRVLSGRRTGWSCRRVRVCWTRCRLYGLGGITE